MKLAWEIWWKDTHLHLFPRVILQDEGYNPIFGVGQTEQVRLGEAGQI